MPDDNQTAPKRIVAATLRGYGMRLPAAYDHVGLDERIRLMDLMTQRIVAALRKERYAVIREDGAMPADSPPKTPRFTADAEADKDGRRASVQWRRADGFGVLLTILDNGGAAYAVRNVPAGFYGDNIVEFELPAALIAAIKESNGE
jgi:hypothetical protein